MKTLSPPGVSMSVNARDIEASQLTVARFREQAGAVLARRLPLSVCIENLGPANQSEALFGSVCRALRAAASDAMVRPANLEIVASANEILPLVAFGLRTQLLGNGTLTLRATDRQLRPCSRLVAHRAYDLFWTQLWQLRNERAMQVAYAPLVTSHCPLLAPEHVGAVLPRTALQVPSGSAWIAGRLRLTDFAGERGAMNEQRLQAALGELLGAMDAGHDTTDWPMASMSHDSWFNRRLAVEVTGIGDLVRARRADPRRFVCLEELSDLLCWIREVLRQRSQELARLNGSAPALAHNNPTLELVSGGYRDGWCQRWAMAIDEHATRNRNLLVISPWSLFPAGECLDPEYVDLLPALSLADACACPAAPGLQPWKINNFINLHQRTAAILEKGSARQLIAEQV